MDKKHILKYLQSIILLTVVFLLVGTVLFKKAGLQEAMNHLYFLTGLFFVISGSFHFILINYVNKKPQKFAQVFMILTVVKILLYLTVLISYIFRMDHHLKAFLFTFLALYLSFTIFEVLQLQKHLKNKGSEEHLIK